MGPDVLGQLVDRHAAALVLYARQWTLAPEDVVQDAFLKLAALPRPPAQVVPWLYRVVRNGALDAWRAEQRRRRHEAGAAGQHPGWFMATEDATLDAEAAAGALDSLSHDQREVIVARLWGGLTFEQIALVTGTSSSATHRLYVAGLSALRERLGVSCPNNPSTRD